MRGKRWRGQKFGPPDKQAENSQRLAETWPRSSRKIAKNKSKPFLFAYSWAILSEPRHVGPIQCSPVINLVVSHAETEPLREHSKATLLSEVLGIFSRSSRPSHRRQQQQQAASSQQPAAASSSQQQQQQQQKAQASQASAGAR